MTPGETLIEKPNLGYLRSYCAQIFLGRGFDCKQIDLVINYESIDTLRITTLILKASS